MRAVPSVWLGAPSAGGLMLPDAHPSASRLYAPRGVWLDDERLIVVDSGNHRVLIWFDRPRADHAPADVVLGQTTFDREGPRAAGSGPRSGFHLPTGVAVAPDGRLFVADAWHHRILVWNRIPQQHGAAPDMVIGQPDFDGVEPNGGGSVSGSVLYWPYGVAFVGRYFVVADTGNRRVLVWDGVPDPGQPADVVLGQDAADAALENRGGPPTASSFRWPHAAAGGATELFVADAGNHRVLRWTPFPSSDREADDVLGQVDFASNGEFPYTRQSARTLRFPYAVAGNTRALFVADTANNRVLVWPRGGPLADAAELAIGQPDLVSNGENRWKRVTHETLCWPYGIAVSGDTLAVADSGNNRVMLWRVSEADVSDSIEKDVPQCV